MNPEYVDGGHDLFEKGYLTKEIPLNFGMAKNLGSGLLGPIALVAYKTRQKGGNLGKDHQ